MSDYKKAIRNKMRFQSKRGTIGVEDLWDLPLAELNEIAKSLNKQYKEDQDDFLNESKVIDTSDFEIVLDVLTTKKEESAQRKTRAERR